MKLTPTVLCLAADEPLAPAEEADDEGADEAEEAALEPDAAAEAEAEPAAE